MSDITALACFVTACVLAVCAVNGHPVLFGFLSMLALVAGGIMLDD